MGHDAGINRISFCRLRGRLAVSGACVSGSLDGYPELLPLLVVDTVANIDALFPDPGQMKLHPGDGSAVLLAAEPAPPFLAVVQGNHVLPNWIFLSTHVCVYPFTHRIQMLYSNKRITDAVLAILMIV